MLHPLLYERDSELGDLPVLKLIQQGDYGSKCRPQNPGNHIDQPSSNDHQSSKIFAAVEILLVSAKWEADKLPIQYPADDIQHCVVHWNFMPFLVTSQIHAKSVFDLVKNICRMTV